ncbi:MAG TPA: DUF1993 domain-containing protein [Xanthomonadales bacterium]|nr:DUF1993 domain-containing protein [Xanthomonadales bacterium]
MTLSIHSVTVPALSQALRQLRHVLDKGAAHARDRGIDPSVLLNMRLYPDMFPLLRQVQIATDMAKNGAARMAVIDPPAFPDDETGFDDLAARIDKTIAFIESIEPARFEGGENRSVTVKTRSKGELRFDGLDHLNNWLLPSVFFHVTTAYCILRHAGVVIGKFDYIGPVTTA